VFKQGGFKVGDFQLKLALSAVDKNKNGRLEFA
jgi:hypothetical protein